MNKYCSPKTQNNTLTCFSKESLSKIATELNKIQYEFHRHLTLIRTMKF